MSVTPMQKPARYIDPNAPLAKQIEMFEALMHDPPENSRVITYTPELSAWLDERYNKEHGNRKKKPKHIRRYATAMSDLNWLLTGETIIFSRKRLLNGQNRLSACVQSGQRFTTHTVFGIDDGVFAAMDSGKSRNAGDMFYTAGIADPGIVSSAVRWLMLYEADMPTSRGTPSNQEAWAFWQDKIDKQALMRAVARSKPGSPAIPRGPLAAHFYMFARKSEKAAAKMTADFELNRHSAKKLMTYIKDTRRRNQGRLHDVWINAMIVRTWGAYRANRIVTARDLKWNTEQEYPAIV